MQTITINTAYRTIHLTCTVERHNISYFERAALQKYAALHQASFELENLYKNWYKRGMQKLASFEALEQIITELEKEIKKYGVLAGYAEEELETLSEAQFQLKPGDLRKKVVPFGEQFGLIYDEYKLFHEGYNHVRNTTEEYSQLFEEFDEQYFCSMVLNYENMLIDTSTFDIDYNEFRTRLDKCMSLEDEVDKLYWRLYEMWNGLAARGNDIIKRFNLIFAHINQWKQLHDNADNNKASLN